MADYYLKRTGTQWTVGEMKFDNKGKRRPGRPIKCFADYAEAAAYYDTLPKGSDITNLRTVCTFRPRGTMMAV